MRATMLVLMSIFLLGGCGGNDDGAANKVKLEGLKKQYKALNGELAAKGPAWQAIKNKVIPARNRWLNAKKGGDESAIAAAKQALDEVSVASDEVIKLEDALKVQIRNLRDKIGRLER